MQLQDYEKELVAKEAVQYVEDRMLLGIGSGSTVYYLIQHLANRIKKENLKIQAVPTSKETANLCKQFGVPLYEGEGVPAFIDLTIDGADEFDDQLNLIKGGGGDLLWEKIVASAGKKVIIITDSTKHVQALGDFGLPIEVVPYAQHIVQKKLKELGFTTKVRTTKDNKIFITDEHNYILDCERKVLQDVTSLALALDSITGVVEHGLFLHIADKVLMAKNGSMEVFVK